MTACAGCSRVALLFMLHLRWRHRGQRIAGAAVLSVVEGGHARVEGRSRLRQNCHSFSCVSQLNLQSCTLACQTVTFFDSFRNSRELAVRSLAFCTLASRRVRKRPSKSRSRQLVVALHCARGDCNCMIIGPSHEGSLVWLPAPLLTPFAHYRVPLQWRGGNSR